MNIDMLFRDFTQYAENSKLLLQEMLSLISEGKVPNQNSVNELDVSIEKLRQKYSAVYQAALSQLSLEEMPDENAAAIEFVEAVQNSLMIQWKKKLKEAEECLRKFISVRSLVEVYAKALSPFQNQAAAMLQSIRSGDEIQMELLEEGTAGPKMFLAALECEDKDSEEGIALCDRIDTLFSPRVGKGMVACKYYIEEKAVKEEFASNGDQDASLSAFSEVEQHSKEKPEIPAEECEPAESVEAKMSPEEPVEAETLPEETETESEFLCALRENGCFIDSEENFGQKEILIGPGENKKISASVFVNEVKHGYGKVNRCILRMLANRNFASLEELTQIHKIPSAVAQISVDYLLKKGYLRRYSITRGGEVLCASPRLMKAMTQRESCNYVGVKQRSEEDWGKSIAEKASSIASRTAFSQLYAVSVSSLFKAGAESYTEMFHNLTEAFCCRIHDDARPEAGELLCGGFWESGEECDEFLTDVRSSIQKAAGLSTVVIASQDLSHAKALCDVLMMVLREDAFSAPISLYALSEHAYYAYPSLERIDQVRVRRDTDSEVAGADSAEDASPVKDMVESDAADLVTEEKVVEDAAEPIAEEAVVENAAEQAAGETVVEDAVDPIVDEIRTEFSVKSKVVPVVSIEEIRANVYRMLCEKRYYAATAYLKAVSGESNEAARLYTQLAYAVNDPMGHCLYSAENAFELMDSINIFENDLVIATALRLFFSDQVRYDYKLSSFYGSIKKSEILTRYPALSKVMDTLADFKITQDKGMDAYADYHAKSRIRLEKEVIELRKDADNFYNDVVSAPKKEKASLKQFLDIKKMIFSVNGDFGIYSAAIKDGMDDMVSPAEEFLRDKFYGKTAEITPYTYDVSMLQDYIDSFWETAGRSMICNRNNKLQGHLRNSITKDILEAVQLLVRWVNLAQRMSDQTDDDGTIEYQKVRKELVENLSEVLTGITADAAGAESGSEERAGLMVLDCALTDLLHCLDGSMDESGRKYFYAPFLLTGDVMLNDDYIPDFDTHLSVLASLQPDQRILVHTEAMKTANRNYTDRLEDNEDNYGSARLITAYLAEIRPDLDLTGYEEQAAAGKLYAREAAERAKDNFIGELELAQSYGQIDNSTEDRKELILQIMNEWYEWAMETENYGFFKQVMDEYLRDIKETAKVREKDLLEQLDKVGGATVPGLNVEKAKVRIAEIRKMIDEQNYTVAEDLLAHFSVIEDEDAGRIDEDFLKEFLDDYDRYYNPVSKRGVSFSMLVNNRPRNKEERGGKRLADNWLPGGSYLGADRLMRLLTGLGFKVNTESIQKKDPINDKYEHYCVQTLSTQNGRRVPLTHPIAAFGSGAAMEGFRIVCINGGYQADELIDIMRIIGDDQHTLILLDDALQKSERRLLAKKTKNALGDKLFAVVDRVVMMFLVNNYDENRINRMLMSLIVPFGYYQPYIWDSAKVMPPEIFIGRKRELAQIKSANGVNIVYGGRQLGKSALLKKAQEEINWNENHDRAIYIDIKHLDYKEVAQRIGHELYDQKILEADIDMTDWNELARVVKSRLQSETAPKIPYLLLLLDEADAFIESCEEINFKPFDALKEIQSIGSGRFKFVVAGLRNVVRFKRKAALGNNSVLTQLQSMTVKPFSTAEARELLELPLHYLGLRFPKEKESLITLILATTNYFPGLIQLYCAKLLEAMQNNDYAGYREADTPIYEVSERHIKKVLADASFNQQIREKFEITLKLDEDDYYYLIALIMAYLYHNEKSSAGYSAADIKKIGDDFGISRIRDLSDEKISALMEEMKELNVLRSTDETHYLFTRFSFLQMMGTSAEVDNRLEEFMED